jgi:hypothetical protein
MFKTLVAAVLRRRGAHDSSSQDTHTRDLTEVITVIINRRLCKLEGLRSYLRRYQCVLGLASGKKASVMYLEQEQGLSETLWSPITRLDQQQRLIIGEYTFNIPELGPPTVIHSGGMSVSPNTGTLGRRRACK